MNDPKKFSSEQTRPLSTTSQMWLIAPLCWTPTNSLFVVHTSFTEKFCAGGFFCLFSTLLRAEFAVFNLSLVRASLFVLRFLWARGVICVASQPNSRDDIYHPGSFFLSLLVVEMEVIWRRTSKVHTHTHISPVAPKLSVRAPLLRESRNKDDDSNLLFSSSSSFVHQIVYIWKNSEKRRRKNFALLSRYLNERPHAIPFLWKYGDGGALNRPLFVPIETLYGGDPTKPLLRAQWCSSLFSMKYFSRGIFWIFRENLNRHFGVE